ncbi:MAG: hypothetical protein JNJ77_17180 [Planctomycetia bacterium]|nr:hypothetical protein [Planctomycetia bacterium]
MFRRCLLLMLVVFMLPVMLGAQDESNLKFQKHQSKEGKYKVEFPGKPMTQNQKANTELGEITIVLDVVAIGQNMAFIVSYNDYPEAITNADPITVLNGVRDGNKGKDGEIIEDRADVFGPDKIPCKRVYIKKPNDLYMKNLMIMKGTRLYQVMVVAKKPAIESDAINKYYKSFELTK